MLHALKRFSWSQSSATSHDGQKQRPGSVKWSKAEDFFLKPTAPEYAYTSEAGKRFLHVLGDVAQEIPLPGVGVVVKVATDLVKACEQSRMALERTEELKLRILTLVAVVVDELKGKKFDEIRSRLKDIELLQNEIGYIGGKLNEIASQRALRMFFRRSNVDKMKDCTRRLDGLLERFNVARQTDHANLLDRLGKEVTAFNDAQKQHKHRDGVEDAGIPIEHVKAIMRDNLSTSSPPLDTRAAIPSSTNFFCGREALVLDLVDHFANLPDGRRHVCLLGVGGMGKTSTALAVMMHADVKTDYPDSQRVWVPCTRVMSCALFLDILASSLCITEMTGDIRENILFALKVSDALILLLDNFETQWNTDGERLEAERLLRDIDRLPHVTLFVTMRSSTPPCEDLFWRSIDLEAVDVEAAHQIYSEIHPRGSVEPQVSEVLELVGRNPLGITLMARIAKLSGLSAETLIDSFKEKERATSSQANHEHTLNICIDVSVDSLPVERNPEARWLLAALATLPAGTTYDMLSTWYAPHLPNLMSVLEVLREASLVESQGLILSVPPAIQRRIIDPSRLDVDVRNSVIAAACVFLENHKFSPDDSSYEGLAAEEGNLEAVLLQAVVPSTEILNALLVLARYQAATRPRTSIIDHALKLVEQSGSQSAHGGVLLCYGSICHNLGRYSESRNHYANARQQFLSVPDRKQAAQCQLAIAKTCIYDDSVTSATRNRLVIQAESEFESIRAIHGVAQCKLVRGINAYQDSNYDEALSLLRGAQEIFVTLGSSFKSAECSRSIALCYYRQDDFEQAKTWSERAVEEFGRLGSLTNETKVLLQLGAVHIALGEYASALPTLLGCLERSKMSAGLVELGLTLEYIGIAWLQQRKRKYGRDTFQIALDIYLAVPRRSDHLRCRYWLRKVEDPSAVPTLEEWEILRLWYPAKALSLFGVERR